MILLETVLTCGALIWLVQRIWHIFKRPLPELIQTLGLDVPIAPDVSLAGIQADSVTLHWTRPVNQLPQVKYFIQINGINIGETSRLETALTVTGLKPDHYYSVRLVATNSENLRAESRAIHVKTLSAQAKKVGDDADSAVPPEQALTLSRTPSHEGKQESSSSGATTPSIDIPPTLHTESGPERDHGSGVSRGRSSTNGQRSSPMASMPETALPPGAVAAEDPADPADSKHSVDKLTEMLDSIRRETNEVIRLISKEDEEYESSRGSLMQERDALKRTLKDRDDASADLRKEVANLDRQNRSAQSRKAAKTKLLHQKQDERAKLREDMMKWDKEMVSVEQDLSRSRKEKNDIARSLEKRLEETRRQNRKCQQAMKSIEEEIKTKGVEIKNLEADRRDLHGDEEDGTAIDDATLEEEEDAKWDIRFRELQTEYARVVNILQQAQENHRQAQERLLWWHSRGITSAAQFASITSVDLEPTLSKKAKPRRTRQRKSRASTVSSSTSTLPTGDSRLALHSHPPGTFVSQSHVSPFFNASNGMAVGPASEPPAIGQSDVDQLTGGAPMSPTANALLPSNLLGDEDALDARMASINSSIGAPVPSSSQGPDGYLPDPNSPVSSGSRSASVFSSPRDSLNNLSMFPSAPGSFIESDRRSISSNSASFGNFNLPADGPSSGSKRFANLFSLNLNRQRGKTLDTAPPALGSLKTSETQSFPTELAQPGGLDPIGTKRRRGTQNTSWVSPMTSFNFLTRNAPTSDGNGAGSSPLKNLPNRRRPFNMFSSKHDPLDPSSLLGDTSSIKRSSLSSLENTFPRPSTDSRLFGWPAAEGSALRSSPLRPDWSVHSGGSWSQSPSRRGSTHKASSSSLSLNVTPYEVNAFSHSFSQNMPPPAIGTRPLSVHANVTPRLNPAAPSFKTIFSRSDARKTEKADKAAEKEREKDHLEWLRDGSSPELSRDSRSIRTQESLAESRDSLEQSVSATASESTTPSASGATPTAREKESIFQKISRKSSSGKFNLSWKEKSSGLFSSKKPLDVAMAGEVDEDTSGSGPAAATGALSVGGDSASNSPNVTPGRAAWNSLRRRSKRVGEKPTSTASEASEQASETGDEE